MRVHPTFIRFAPLAAVSDVFNAIFVQGDVRWASSMFYGRGARPAHGAAVVATSWRPPGACAAETALPPADLPVKPEETVSRFYVSSWVVDWPGVLAAIAGAARHGVSINSVIQKGRFEDPIDLVFVTHEVQEAHLRRALAEIDQLTWCGTSATSSAEGPDVEGRRDHGGRRVIARYGRFAAGGGRAGGVAGRRRYAR